MVLILVTPALSSWRRSFKESAGGAYNLTGDMPLPVRSRRFPSSLFVGVFI
jgi:hypothetical protein